MTLWTVAHQAPLSMGFSRQENWSGWPFPPPGDLPDPGIKPESPALQVDSLPLSYQGSHIQVHGLFQFLAVSSLDHLFGTGRTQPLKLCPVGLGAVTWSVQKALLQDGRTSTAPTSLDQSEFCHSTNGCLWVSSAVKVKIPTLHRTPRKESIKGTAAVASSSGLVH